MYRDTRLTRSLGVRLYIIYILCIVHSCMYIYIIHIYIHNVRGENYRRQTRNGPDGKTGRRRNPRGRCTVNACIRLTPSDLILPAHHPTRRPAGRTHTRESTTTPIRPACVYNHIRTRESRSYNKGTLLVSGCAGFAGVCERAYISPVRRTRCRSYFP